MREEKIWQCHFERVAFFIPAFSVAPTPIPLSRAQCQECLRNIGPSSYLASSAVASKAIFWLHAFVTRLFEKRKRVQ